MNPKRSGMVLMVAVVFFAAVLASAWAVPASSEETAAAQPGKNDSKIKEKDEPTAAFEKNSEEKQIQKKKKFPWLLAAAGAVAVGMVVYFTLIKKPKYKLTVTCGEGALGSLTTGEYRYRKGEIVSYGFVLKPGWKNLQVLLDGQPVAAAGTIKMDRDHSLEVSAEEVTYSLTVNCIDSVKGNPRTGVYRYRNGKAVSYSYDLISGWKNLQVILDGQPVAGQGTIKMDRDHSLQADAEKEDMPRDEAFNEEGTWMITEDVIGDKTYTYWVTFQRVPGLSDEKGHGDTGYVDMQSGLPCHQFYHVHYRRELIMKENTVMLSWVTLGSRYLCGTNVYKGYFTDNRSIKGEFWYYDDHGGTGCRSYWTMTKVN